MEKLLQDIRYGFRMMLKSPSFSIIATIALALGIGANTAIFSVVNAVLLRPLPFPESERLMNIWETNSQRGLERGSASYPNAADWREQSKSFEHVSTYRDTDFVLTGRGEPIRLQGAVTNANIFSLLRVTPELGRGFLPHEDNPNEAGRVVLISRAIFENRFNSDPGILNQSITLDGNDYTVIGVMPRAFQFPIQNETTDVWTTIALDSTGSEPATQQRGAHFLQVIGRLKSGTTQEQAQSELNAIAGRLEQQYPDTNLRRGIKVEPTLEALVGDIRPALLVLLGAVACVLLIACANVANLLLARAMGRHKEMAIRSALGASRVRVVRQLLTESLMLSLAGGAVGLLLAVWWADVMVALGKEDIPRAMHVSLDWRVLGFTLGVSVLTGVVFGLVPALHSSKERLVESLKEGRGSGEKARRNRIRGLLVVSELAIAVVLLVGAGLLIQSLWRLRQVNPGFNSHNVLTFTVALPDVKYKTERQAEFFRDLASRIQSMPGVTAASTVVPLPLSGNRYSISFETEGRPIAKGELPSADFFTIGLNYFKAMGIPLKKGRDFKDLDQHKSQQVIIVNESFAKRFFPGEDPIGKRIHPGISSFDGEDSQMREIVGVVGDVRNRNLRTEARPGFYVPITQTPFSQMTVLVKTTTDPRELIRPIANDIARVDGDLPMFSVKTLEEYLATSVSASRFNSTLLGIFAAVALVLTVVGLYGVMSYSVAQRTNEIGIRMALGAQTEDVLKLIVGQGFKLVLVGLALGLIGAFAATRLLASLLFGVSTKDPFTFIAVAAALSFVALLACYLPARRAAKVDPLEALRYE
jgi:putative ABC transport system permease protein